jgi:hypothetical protein
MRLDIIILKTKKKLTRARQFDHRLGSYFDENELDVNNVVWELLMELFLRFHLSKLKLEVVMIEIRPSLLGLWFLSKKKH